MNPRVSYWKTTALSFFGAILCLALAYGLYTVLPPYLAALAVAIGGVSEGILLSVTAGGLVCIWRDARDSAGKEDLFARLAIKDPVVLPFRVLLGAGIRPGDYVAVRALAEIEATLDGQRTLQGLPFMREMEAYCGKIFRVHRRVDHINDMRNKTGPRRLRHCVTLSNVRCDGADHAGCEAECQILWKDAWLQRVPAPMALPKPVPAVQNNQRTDAASEPAAGQTFFCQMTRLWEASEPLSTRDVRYYLRPLLSGNVGIRDYLVAMLTRVFNIAQRLRGGAGYPHMAAPSAAGRTPAGLHSFQSGDAVRVCSKNAIAATLGPNGRNRGLWFDRDMVRYCGRPAVVQKRVSRLIHEATGEMVVMKTPCLILRDVIATGEFLTLCPQHEHIFWRDVWLRPDTNEKTKNREEAR